MRPKKEKIFSIISDGDLSASDIEMLLKKSMRNKITVKEIPIPDIKITTDPKEVYS